MSLQFEDNGPKIRNEQQQHNRSTIAYDYNPIIQNIADLNTEPITYRNISESPRLNEEVINDFNQPVQIKN